MRISPRVWFFLIAALTVGSAIIAFFVWFPGDAAFPAPDFYVVAAGVIPLLLIAVTVERATLATLEKWMQVALVVTLLAAEFAAFIALSGIFSNGDDERLVGGSEAWTALLGTLTASGLLGSALLVAVIVLVAEAPLGRDIERRS